MNAELELARGFVEEYPDDAARCLEELAPLSASALLAECDAAVAARALDTLAPGFAAECLAAWPEAGLSDLLASAEDASLARLMRRLADAARERVVQALSEARVARLATLMAYPERSVGALMRVRLLALPGTTTVAGARCQLKPLRDAGVGAVYVLDPSGELSGVVSLSRLASADAHETLNDLAAPAAATLAPLNPGGSVLAHAGWTSTRELPVVDARVGLVGVLRLEDVERLDVDDRAAANPAVSVTLALGELYWRMASGLMGAVAAGSEVRDER